MTQEEHSKVDKKEKANKNNLPGLYKHQGVQPY